MRRLFSLLLLIALASALTMVVRTSDGTDVLASESLVAKANAGGNTLEINGILTVPMFPTITVGGKPINASAPSAPELAAGSKPTSYTVGYSEAFGEGVFASADVEVTNEFISHVILLENTGDKEVTVDLEVLPKANGNYYLFAPYKRDPAASYIWISPALAAERAEGIVVAFDNVRPTYDLPAETNTRNNFARVLAWSIPLAPNEKRAIGMKYRPGYINDETLLSNNTRTPAVSKQYILDTQSEPLFIVVGANASAAVAPATSATATSADVLEMFKQTMDSIPDTPTAESTLASLSVDLGGAAARIGAGLNSIEKALLFREMSRSAGIPSEIHVGLKDGNYYAWAVSYVGPTGIAYDPAGKMADYVEVYKEPEPEGCRGDIYACPWSGGIRADLFCLGPVCLPAYLLIALLVLGFVTMFVVFQYKPELIYGILGGKKKGAMLVADTVDGMYDLVNDKFLPKDPLEESVWNALRRRGGSFKAADYVTETGFSEVLIKGVMEGLVEKKVVRKQFG